MTPTAPLHTNTTKKIVFAFSFLASTFFSVLLFQSIGSNIPLKIVWSLVAIGTVFFQTVKLREYYNTKKPENLMWDLFLELDEQYRLLNIDKE